MLRNLDIRDMLIIDHLSLDFQSGLNVLTGETGAGKSILLDSLGFVLGWRGRADLVRQGADQGEVTAVFDLSGDHPANAVLQEAGLPTGSELILRRVNMPDGRKTAWINDRRCSGEVLRAVSDHLVELHGQHDDRGLLEPRGHLAILDEFAGNVAAMAKTRSAWRTLRDAQMALEQAQSQLQKMREEEDFLRHAVAELDQLMPESGEDATLDAQRRLMQQAEKIGTDISKAAQVLSDGAEVAISDALRWLEGVADRADGRLDPAIDALVRVMAELSDAQQAVQNTQGQLSFNPLELEQIEERLFSIRALARKHAVVPDDLGGFADGLRNRLSALDQGDADIAALDTALCDAQSAYDTAAAALSEKRRTAAKKLDKAVMAELAPLKMERAVFETTILPKDSGPDGVDSVAFQVATNPGAPAGPLNKIASGGELSRFLLALKVCLTGGSTSQTIIFDEIDRGVGGATADAVGARLKSLAQNGQVLVVTHSPQVAAKGAHHWRVEKRVENGQTLSTVTPLSDADRVDEIARMVAGDIITDQAKGAARVLLDGAA